MTPEMAFECLIVSSDVEVFCPVERILRDLSVCSNPCLSPSKAISALRKSEIDLIVIDWDEKDVSELMQEIWASTTKPKPTILAISAANVLVPGAHIVLRKPLTNESARKSLQLAYSRMLTDHRRHSRYVIMIPVMATDKHGRAIPLTVADIGDGGVGLRAKEELSRGDAISFRLLLPGTRKEIYIQARVAWTSGYGLAGCEFVHLPPIDVDILHQWLKGQIKVKRPRVPFQP